ncbi:MAG: hypothetical protein AMXMBFR82_24030 [Candidatus Hydrogenedentota bacterium]
MRKINGEHTILTVNGVLGACNAALVLTQYPNARIQITSERHIVVALKECAVSSGNVHVCGVGCAEPREELVSALAELSAHVTINWYAGHEHPELIKEARQLRKHATIRFWDDCSDTEAIRRGLKVALSESVNFILELASVAGVTSGVKNSKHKTWTNRIEAANYRFYILGDEHCNDRVIRALADPKLFDRELEEKLRPYMDEAKRKTYPLGSSKQMTLIRKRVGKLGPIPEPVLIGGPTGAGKEVVARALHVASRRTGRFVAFNCAVLGSNPQMAESRLFGYAKGAFTGAVSDRPGAFQDANGGTLFLDEIGELAVEVQAHLLRALETGFVAPVGTTKEDEVDVRIVVATHRNLHQMVAEGAFREDLLYRLNVLSIRVPPLCERRQDMKSIAAEVARKLQSHGHRLKLRPQDWMAIDDYDWPGNVRQFINVLKRRAYLGDPLASLIDEERQTMYAGTPEEKENRMFAPGSVSEVMPADEVYGAYLRHVHRLCGENVTRAARVLQIAPNTLRKHLDGYGKDDTNH